MPLESPSSDNHRPKRNARQEAEHVKANTKDRLSGLKRKLPEKLDSPETAKLRTIVKEVFDIADRLPAPRRKSIGLDQVGMRIVNHNTPNPRLEVNAVGSRIIPKLLGLSREELKIIEIESSEGKGYVIENADSVMFAVLVVIRQIARRYGRGKSPQNDDGFWDDDSSSTKPSDFIQY